MRCFNHVDREAVGSCKGCQKGLCAECAIDLGHGLACKGVHEQIVNTYNVIMERDAQIYRAAPRVGLITPIFAGLLGLVFLAFGLLLKSAPFNLPSAVGLGFIVFGGLFYRFSRRAFGGNSHVSPS